MAGVARQVIGVGLLLVGVAGGFLAGRYASPPQVGMEENALGNCREAVLAARTTITDLVRTGVRAAEYFPKVMRTAFEFGTRDQKLEFRAWLVQSKYPEVDSGLRRGEGTLLAEDAFGWAPSGPSGANSAKRCLAHQGGA